ncbi:PEP-CTERM system TPR-repeat protein PrsT [Thalassotalea sp. LPB0316]|uniref:XrtA/PEP-CTERM system TPR-repeat protein PrsT n=1 Tax=Thalassotalea sp. LPB0316 TaxID=2769490 RepID=UPI001865D99B|nr:XrtA/PEP-CTERM system TPR-repeat protein PrsT [Thalassotalea sp. LPB0316]QOL26507.1 PEP-CTERM system TPR-repeat protein PrsT [Thalassotalea sp. LPB0316]
MNFRKQVLLSALTLSILSACSKPLSEEETLALAEQNIAAGKIAEASINIKNVIKENPKNAQARFLLGKLYFDQEQYLAAEKELLRSIEYAPNDQTTRMLLARTFHALNKNEDVIDMLSDVALSDQTAMLQKEFLLGKSFLALDNNTDAKKHFDLASEIDGTAKESQLGQILYTAAQQDHATALSQVNELLITFPTFVEALLLQGNLYNHQGEFSLSASAYEAYFKLKPQNFAVRLLAAYNHVRAGNIERAKSHISELNKINDRHPTINLIDAQIQFAEQNYQRAKELSDRVANNTNNGLAQMISGLSSYYLNNYEQAYYQLNAIADALPANHQIHRVLALLQVKLGYVDDFDQELLSNDNLSAEDVELLTAVGMEEFYQGNNQAAQELFLKASDLSPEDAKVKAQLGMIKINNQDASGISDLEQAIAIDPTFKGANIALAMKHLADGNTEAAAKVADNWIKQEPTNPEPLILRGNVALNANNNALAKQYFLKAVEVEPNNTTALFNLAVMTSSSQNFDESNEYLDKIFAITLESKFAFQLAIKNAISTQQEPQLEQKLIKQVEQNQGAQWPRIVLARRYAKQGLIDKSINIFQGIDDFASLSNDYLISYTTTLIEAGKAKETVDVFTQWQTSQPTNKVAYLSSINFFETTKQFDEALKVTQSALSVGSLANDIELLSYEAYFLLATGSTELASKKINTLAQRYGDNAFVQRVQGQAYLAQKQFAQAQKYLSASYAQKKHAATGINLAIAIQENEGTEQAISFVESEIANNRHTKTYLQYLAQLQISTKPNDAISSYQRLVQANPKDIVSLNNLAWLLADANQLDQALTYAEQAANLAPNNPQVLDTLGMIYLNKNSLKESIEVLERANSIDSGNIEIAARLASAYKLNKNQVKLDSLLNGYASKDRESILKLMSAN